MIQPKCAPCKRKCYAINSGSIMSEMVSNKRRSTWEKTVRSTKSLQEACRRLFCHSPAAPVVCSRKKQDGSGRGKCSPPHMTKGLQLSRVRLPSLPCRPARALPPLLKANVFSGNTAVFQVPGEEVRHRRGAADVEQSLSGNMVS